MSTPRKRIVSGQWSWCFGSRNVEAALTVRGGHLAPVTFTLGRRKVEPFAIAPWAEEPAAPDSAPVLQALRGDFFCLPFGANELPRSGKRHPLHGDTANGDWSYDGNNQESGIAWQHWTLDMTSCAGRVRKSIGLREGETNLYIRHRISGVTGPMSLGHHAMLKFQEGGRPGFISTSKLLLGQTAPAPFGIPAQREYQALHPGGEFKDLAKARGTDGTKQDLTIYPARRGFDDLVMLIHESAPDFAWTAVTFPDERFVWFSLKNPQTLRSTILWFSNGGRHAAPWNGRHIGVLGVEDVTAYFHYGQAESSEANPIRKAGYSTSHRLDPRTGLTVNYIMGVAAVPKGFGRVRSVIRKPNHIVLTSFEGKSVISEVDTTFLVDSPQTGQRRRTH